MPHGMVEIPHGVNFYLGHKHWHACPQDADALRQESQQVTQRASEVIAASTAASARFKTGSGVRARPTSAPYPR